MTAHPQDTPLPQDPSQALAAIISRTPVGGAMDIALDPSERRPVRAPVKVAPAATRRPFSRIVLASALGVVGLGAFAAATTGLMAGLTEPKPAAVTVGRGSAADWPDLKDGLPVLSEARAEPDPATTATLRNPAAEAALVPGNASLNAAGPMPQPAAEPAVTVPPRPAPSIQNVSVVGEAPARQAAVVPPPSRAAATVAPRPSETVRARSAATSFAALPSDPAAPKPSPVPKTEAKETKPETPRADKPRDPSKDAARDSVKDKAKPVAARKPPVQAVADAAPAAPAVAAEPDETEVLGIKVPSLKAIGEAVRSLPDRF